jgi:hypothetical protein
LHPGAVQVSIDNDDNTLAMAATFRSDRSKLISKDTGKLLVILLPCKDAPMTD